MKSKSLYVGMLCCGFSVAYAAPLMIDSHTLNNFDQTIQKVKSLTTLPIEFPAQVPQDVKKAATLYMNYDPSSTTSTGYTLYVDSTPDCQGAHYCNIGTLQVSNTGSPEQYQDISHHLITKTIKVSGNVTVYYTPGHALGDYWSPVAEWQNNGRFYHLSWDLANSDAQSVLLQMVQSMQTY